MNEELTVGQTDTNAVLEFSLSFYVGKYKLSIDAGGEKPARVAYICMQCIIEQDIRDRYIYI